MFFHSLKDQEAGWRQQAKDNGSNELLLANCLAAAGFLTYCGAVNIDTRSSYSLFVHSSPSIII